MKLVWLLILFAALFLHPAVTERNTSQTVVCNETAKNYSLVPLNLNINVSVLCLSYNNIALNKNDTQILRNYINIRELYLNNNSIAVLRNYSFQRLSKLAILDVSNNSITAVEQAAFAGLSKLMTLHLQNNRITQLDSNAFILLKSLKVLTLQNNHLGNFDIKVSLNLSRIILSGNPWNCSCGLYSLQSWLDNTNVTMENENNTVCTSPNNLKNNPIKTTILPNCQNGGLTGMTTISSIFTSPNNDTLISAKNNTNGRSLNSGVHHFGKSWTFLMGVLVILVGTTLLIVMAIKFPVWYRYFRSYNHRRLEEDEPEMFEETFTPHMCTFPQTPASNEDESVVVFEQFHTFVPEDDGFIEDKYIDP
ncbi:leucine-rich repeat-containing protein 19 [Elgaria multicarinata webbii]|uniref:leucine-rich repeat-containing protein 19 n=1 Tax=Elgaria multicarinata webbii TaxID=159646 RepID=UPI002FCCDA77